MNRFFPIFIFICIMISHHWLCGIEKCSKLSKWKYGGTTDISDNYFCYQESNISDMNQKVFSNQKTMVCDSLITKLAHDWLVAKMIEWWIRHDFQCNSMEYYFIISTFIAVIIQPSSILSIQWTIPFPEAKFMHFFSINDCTVLSIYWSIEPQMRIII